MPRGDHNDPAHDEGPSERPDDDATLGAPPDPADRLWVHPTELPPVASGFAPHAPPERRAPSRTGRAWAAPIVAGAAGALVAVAVLMVAGAFDRAVAPRDRAAADTGTSAAPTAAQVTQWTGSSVVAITAHDGSGTRHGSGVCVRHATEILTSARLVGDADTVDVDNGDGGTHVAHVAGRDRTTDVVLLTLDGSADIPAARLADQLPQPGIAVWVVAARAPGTTAHWMSAGLLSANDATLARDGGPMTTGLLQTDAATTTPAIGGALVDSDGAVAGIVLGRFDNDGTAYAIPVATALRVAEQLRLQGIASHGDAGMTAEDAAAGTTVKAVTPGGGAAQAGVKPGDVVTAVNGRPVASEGDLVAIVRSAQPGQQVTVALKRSGTSLDVRIAVGAEKG